MNGYSKIKIFGPGIPDAIQILSKLGNNGELGEKFVQSGPSIGFESDFDVLWKEDPSKEEILTLIEIIDKLLLDTKVRYSITSSTSLNIDELLDMTTEEAKAYTLIRLYGPSISKGLKSLNNYVNDITGVKSTTGELIGPFDFALEWYSGSIPEMNDIIRVLGEIDKILKNTGVTYRVVTKSRLTPFTIRPKKQDKRGEKVLRFF